MLRHSLYFRGVKNYGPCGLGAPECRGGGPCSLHNLHNILLCRWPVENSWLCHWGLQIVADVWVKVDQARKRKERRKRGVFSRFLVISPARCDIPALISTRDDALWNVILAVCLRVFRTRINQLVDRALLHYRQHCLTNTERFLHTVKDWYRSVTLSCRSRALSCLSSSSSVIVIFLIIVMTAKHTHTDLGWHFWNFLGKSQEDFLS